MTSVTEITTSYQHFDWETPDISCLPSVNFSSQDLKFHLFRLDEISEDKPKAYRQAIANVFASLNTTNCACLYILSGQPQGIDLYIGVASNKGNADIHEAGKIFEAGFKGNFLGAQLSKIKDDSPEINDLMKKTRHFGLMMGVPSFNDHQASSDEEDFQGVERLVNSLLGETWQLIIVAEPASDEEIRTTLSKIYDLASELSECIKHSVQRSENTGYQSTETISTSNSHTEGNSESDTRGKSKGVSSSEGTSKSDNSTRSSKGKNNSWSSNEGYNESKTTGVNTSETTGDSKSVANGVSHGNSLALTSERTDKRAEGMLKHVGETLVERFLRGRSKGMYRTSVYLSAENRSTYDRLTRGAVSTFQGNLSSFTPLRVHDLPDKPYALAELLQQRCYEQQEVLDAQALAHSIPILAYNTLVGATWLNTEELALIAGMPSREVPGLKIRKSVDFALNTNAHLNSSSGVELGHIIQHGRTLPHSVVSLSPEDLRKHIFVTGVTGAGKTTTCLNLLLRSGLPFMVIEPAKTEYRALYGHHLEIEYYCLGREDLTPFRLNPLQLVSPRQSLASHIDTLKATLAAVFPMEAAMPQIVEEAIIKAYQKKGWMIYETENLHYDDPWAADSDAWPTFSGMIAELDAVITSKGMGKEFEEKYRGSLVARLTSLTLGTKGRMLNTRRSIDFDKLLDKCVVIELEELKDEQDKALFMGLIIARLAECIKQRYRENSRFRHLTLVEEAHRLLSQPEPGDTGARKMGVNMFANLLAEVRKYGEGLIIADQIPNKLVSDVIKNTNTKIVHRLFAADDRNSIGDAMGLTNEQKDFLPMLQPGETIIYCGGWHGPVRLKINDKVNCGSEPTETDILRCGQHQLWEQRQFLLPHLAELPNIDTPELLSEFLRDAYLMLNMLFQLNPKRKEQKAPSQRERLRERLNDKQQAWLLRLEMNQNWLADGICRVFHDCVLQPYFVSDDDYYHLEICFAQGLETLGRSLDDFDQLKDRSCMNSFNSLLHIDSI